MPKRSKSKSRPSNRAHVHRSAGRRYRSQNISVLTRGDTKHAIKTLGIAIDQLNHLVDEDRQDYNEINQTLTGIRDRLAKLEAAVALIDFSKVK
jgi:hypothetical protein